MKKALVIVLALAMVLTCFVGCGEKEEKVVWPEEGKTLTIVVPYNAGGNTDLVARGFATELQKSLGINVIVENKAGSAGIIDMLDAEPDGYTIACVANGIATLTPQTQDVGYTNKEIAQIASVAETATLFFVNGQFAKENNITDFKSFVDYVKASPETLTYACANPTQIAAVFCEQVCLEAGIKMNAAGQGGGAKAAQQCAGGHYVCGVAGTAEVAASVATGDIVLLWCTTGERVPAYPDVPSAKELGYSLDGASWTGFITNIEVDPAVVAKIDEAIKACLEAEDIKTLLANTGNDVVYLNHEEYAKSYNAEYEANGKVLEALGLIKK